MLLALFLFPMLGCGTARTAESNDRVEINELARGAHITILTMRETEVRGNVVTLDHEMIRLSRHGVTILVPVDSIAAIRLTPPQPVRREAPYVIRVASLLGLSFLWAVLAL